jgi:hypothetical protein
VNVSWDDTDLNQLALNLLSLTDSIRKCIENHLRYRRHLYLDRNQSFGEMQMNKNSDNFVKQDYMMKIRPKQWKADCSVFHLMMSEGHSVSVFCFKGRIDAYRLEQLRRAGAITAITANTGDYILIWIDSFGSNTGENLQKHLNLSTSCRPHERAEATEARAVARQENSKAAQAQVALDKVVSDRAPFQCIDCERRFAREASMDGHLREETRSTLQQSASSEANKKLPSEAPTTIPVPPTTNSHERRLLMGHCLQMGRSATVLDDAVKRVLVIQFQLGVTKSSNRKGVSKVVRVSFSVCGDS